MNAKRRSLLRVARDFARAFSLAKISVPQERGGLRQATLLLTLPRDTLRLAGLRRRLASFCVKLKRAD